MPKRIYIKRRKKLLVDYIASEWVKRGGDSKGFECCYSVILQNIIFKEPKIN